jgi:hypothetical protein
MEKFKDYLVTGFFTALFLLLFFVLDDSYENANLSAQVLDEAIAQAYKDKKEAKTLLILQQEKISYSD